MSFPISELKIVIHTVYDVVDLVGAAIASLVLENSNQNGEEKVKPVLQALFTHA